MMRTYIATSTTNLQACGLRILAVAPTRQEAEAKAQQAIAAEGPATDICVQTLARNLRVHSRSALARKIGTATLDRLLAEYEETELDRRQDEYERSDWNALIADYEGCETGA